MRQKSPSRRACTYLGALFLVSVCVLFLAPEASYSQASTATFFGTATDPSGAVVPNAEVTLTEQNTNAVLSTKTGTNGNFVFNFVPVGTYTLKIQAKGFRTLVSSGIELSAGQRIKKTFTLELGAVTQAVTVQGGAPLVNTVSAEQLTTFQPTQVQQLPLQNRNFARILDLTPGTVPSTGGPDGVNMNGVGTEGTQYSLDGINASGDTGSNTPAAYQAPNLIDIMSTDGIQEVSVVKGVIPAEYADAVGGQVNLIMKSGTNQWHGSLFENLRNKALDARLQTLSTKPSLVYNQFGGSLGGPIKKNKIFIFGDYEAYRVVEGQLVQGNAPTQTLRTQLLNAVPDYKYALDAFPLPNQPTAPGALVGLFQTAKGALWHDNHFDFHGDVLLTPNSRLSVIYNRGTPVRTTPRYYIKDSRSWLNTMNRVGLSYTLSKVNWVFETKFGFNKAIQVRTDEFYSQLNPNQSQESFSGAQRLPDLQTGIGFGGPDGEANHSGGPALSFSEKIAHVMGRHSIKFGGDFIRVTGTRNNPQIPDFYYPTLDALLTNSPASLTATFGNGDFSMRSYEFGGFAQDDFQVNRKLTVNAGLRYDFYSNFRSIGQGGTAAAGIYNPSFLSMDGKFNVGPFRPVNAPFNNAAVNLGPRFGFAYNPDGHGKTAIRGGFGMMYSRNAPEIGWFATAIGQNIPSRYEFGADQINQFGIQYPEFNQNFLNIVQQLASAGGSTPVSIAQMFDSNLKVPYTMQFSLDIQRQLTPTLMFSTAFVRTRGVHFIEFRYANKVGRLTGVRPNPNLSQFVYDDNSQGLTYNAWMSSLIKRYSNNLTFTVNYTWSKGITNGTGDFGAWFTGANTQNLNQEFFDLKADQGRTSFNMTHVFTAGWVYELPHLEHLSPIARNFLGGWQASGIFRGSTGLPVTVTQSSSLHGDRTDYIGGPAVLSNYQSTLQYLNPAAFQLIPLSAASGAPIRPGNAGPNEFTAPGQWGLDFSAAKSVHIREKIGFQVRADMFNAFNHTNLSGLVTNLNNPFFGRLQSTRGARIIQIAAKLTF
jgi:hypothetical protein